MIICEHTSSIVFRTATASGGNQSGPNCVEVGFAAATASGSAGHCVEPGQAKPDEHATCTPETCSTPGVEPGDIVVRDSKNNGPGCPVAVFRPEEWARLVERVAAGDDADHRATDEPEWVIADPRTSVVLWYTEAEWEAFRDGCRKHEFDYAPLTTVPA